MDEFEAGANAIKKLSPFGISKREFVRKEDLVVRLCLQFSSCEYSTRLEIQYPTENLGSVPVPFSVCGILKRVAFS